MYSIEQGSCVSTSDQITIFFSEKGALGINGDQL